MSQIIEYVITDNGAVEQRQIYSTIVRNPQQAIAALCSSASVRIVKMLPDISISFLGHRAWATCKLDGIQIDTNWRTEGECIVPAYGDAARPAMRLKWVPPGAMSLYLFVGLIYSVDDVDWMRTDQVYLVAVDEESNQHRTHRLPLANIHNTCQVCMGSGYREAFRGDLLTNLQKTVEWFQNSKYNADLTDDLSRSRSAQLFRFKPNATGFGQQDSENWRELITPAAIDLFQHFMP